MADRVLIAISDSDLAGEVTALVEESPRLELVDTVAPGSVAATLAARAEVEVVLLHDPAVDAGEHRLAREIAAAHPQVGIVLVARSADPDFLRSALRSGARDVLALPLSLGGLERAAAAAASWSRAVRRERPAEETGPIGSGRILAVAGSKGGVGTTTIAVYLALASLARANDVCVADFDLQCGDVRFLLDLPPSRGIGDLAALDEEISERQLADTTYSHRSGLRVLLPPEHGENAEAVSAAAARRILGALAERHELVVVDVGSVATEAGAVAAGLATQALVVATPDVPSLRGANRLLELWGRLGVREPDAAVAVLNRAHKRAEIQPDLARRVLAAPLARTTIPDETGALEVALNSGRPERLESKGLQRAYLDLAAELVADTGRHPEEPADDRASTLERRLRSESGQVAAETIGTVWLMVLVALALWQIVLVGYTYVLAGHGAREGARALAVGEGTEKAVENELPGAWRDGAKVSDASERVRVALAVPLVVPGVDGPIRVSSSAKTVEEGAS